MHHLEIGEREFKLRLTEPMLGTKPKNKKVYARFIGEKIKKLQEEKLPEELDDVQEQEEAGWTGFLEDENGLYINDYMIKGFLKTACQAFQENKAFGKIPAYKKIIDEYIHIYPRKIYLGKKEPDGILERSLRAMGPKGPRVTLSRSDEVSEGTEMIFIVKIIKNNRIDMEKIKSMFEYGQFSGLGQWRNAGYGRFEVVA